MTNLEAAGSDRPEASKLQQAEIYVRENPGVALVGAVAAGFALGMIARSLERKPEPEPIRDALRELRTKFSPFAKRTRQASADAAESVREVVESAVEKARRLEVDRYAGRANRWWQRLWA